MKYLLPILLAVAVLGGCASTQVASPTGPAAPLTAIAVDKGAFMTGTLAPIGSFLAEAGPVYTRVVVMGHQVQTGLQAKTMTVAQAKAIYASADQAKGLADRARQVCGEDPMTGRCTKDGRAAEDLLSQAFAVLSAVK
jgi:hypothetical protein